jgi:hypothetical protein
MRLICCFLALTAIVAFTSSDSAAAPPDGFQALFNGENLDGLHGWTHAAMQKYEDASPADLQAITAEWTADAKKHWSVENGELVNDGHGAYLATDGKYRDYELLLEYKTVAAADCGIILPVSREKIRWCWPTDRWGSGIPSESSRLGLEHRYG